VLTIQARWNQEHGRKWEYDPPLSFVARVAAVPLILAIDAFAAAALVWMLGGG
jgi:hypothetical protein